MDRLLIYGPTSEQLFERIRANLERFKDRGFKLNGSRSRAFEREAKRCGRVVSQTGVRFDDAMITGLCNIPEPTTAAELQQFLCAMG